MLASQEARIRSVLTRKRPVDPLSCLIGGISGSEDHSVLDRTAIVFDASVFLRLATHRKAADVVDYLSARHQGPLVIPGQAIQEFWNNQLSVVDTIASSLSKKFEDLSKEIEKFDSLGGQTLERIRSDIDSLRADYGHIYDDSTKSRTISVLEMLKQRAIVPFANRSAFEDLAVSRKMTKTPPGFKDTGNGDFYTWIDMLVGLSKPNLRDKFDTVAFITQDVKPDWSRAGLPHPLLSMEVKELLNSQLVMWNLDKLVLKIDAEA